MKANASRHSAFTLTELLVAIALIVVLMLAVNTIFSVTANTISSGQALSTGMRDMRSVQTIIKKDLDGALVADGPCFIIRSVVQPGFVNRKDQLSDTDYVESDIPAMRMTAMMSADTLGNGAEVTQPATAYGVRTFRQDVLGLFSRGLFQRQTGNDGTFAALMTSNEAFVSYGHLYQPDAAGTPVAPGFADLAALPITYSTAATNPNNFFASQWVLGHSAILLLPKSSTGTINDGSGVPQAYINRTETYTATTPDWNSVHPLAPSSPSLPGGTTLSYSRYDLAATTIDLYRSAVANYAAAAPANAIAWWDAIIYRFAANPFPARPLTAASAAQTVPIFVPNCSEFIVEYAGDFTTQVAATGAFSSTIPDGTLDFVVDATGSRRIRWYGMPRSTTGNTTVSLANGDVVPLRDFAGAAQTFERTCPILRADYANTGGTGLAPGEQYVCAWGPDTLGGARPSMLRILIKPEDPNGKIDLPWQEMVFTLP